MEWTELTNARKKLSDEEYNPKVVYGSFRHTNNNKEIPTHKEVVSYWTKKKKKITGKKKNKL